MTTVTERIKALIQPSIEAFGLELWGIQLASQGRKALLRIYIESAQGITIDDCEKVSRQISSILEVESPIHSAYILEVSSPGIERSLFDLDHFKRSIGKEAKVKLTEAIEDRRTLVGKIIAAHDDERIELEMGDKIYRFTIGQVHTANLVYTGEMKNHGK